MVLIKIDNSFSSVQGMDIALHKKIKNALSYLISLDGINSQRVSLLSKSGEFPSGLVHVVKKALATNKQPYKIQDLRTRPQMGAIQFSFKSGVTPYKEQLEACNAALKSHRGCLSMATGTGKSITMAMLIAKLGVKTLVIVPNLQLKQQLTETFKHCFGNLNNITVENIDSRSLHKQSDYDCLIVDEAHHSAAKTYRTLNKKYWTNIYYRFFFTATPFRSNTEELLLLQSITGEVIYTLDYFAAVNSGLITPVEAYYIEVPRKDNLNNPNSWASVYSELVVNNDVRNSILVSILFSLHANGKSTLCLVKQIEHGVSLSAEGAFLFANGKDENTNEIISKFVSKKVNVLIGTTGVIGEGTDTKPCEYVVIAGLGKSKNAFMQQVGRVVRRYPGKETGKVIIILDKSHKWSRAHFKAQCKILEEEYGVVPIKLEIT